MRIHDTLKKATKSLSAISHSPRIDAEILMAHVLKKNRSFLYAYPEYALSNSEQLLWQQLLEQRLHSVPVAYLVGEREFWSLPFYVSPATLIPRPATESMVAYILNHYPNTPLQVCDLGTGTGAIAISLKHERPLWDVLAIDIQPNAIALAQKNAQRHHTPISLICSNWFENIPKSKFHIIVSNPPYIDPEDPHLQQGDVQHEPQSALISDKHGLADIEYLLQNSAKHLHQNGIMIFEHGYNQQERILKMMQTYGWQNAQGFQDEEGQPRFCVGFYHVES
ncbi:MAG: peptide chain release factor N(5)-glutamine methyltransferase [Gammaproteobacteria bacterium]|nr:peptide chain release factor N(5)-glutamine methyltransferase [Gammaproteobacteria bacterium]